MTNEEIISKNLELIRTCVECQFAKLSKEYMEDFFHDLVIELLEYDNGKLNNAVAGNHLNALITKFIRNNIYSKTSWYYRRYRKWEALTEELDYKENANEAD